MEISQQKKPEFLEAFWEQDVVKNTAVSILTFMVLGVALAAAQAAQTVGSATIVIKTVTGKLEEQERRIVLEDGVFQNELIKTEPSGAAEVIFLDKTTLSIGPNSTLTLDKFIYDPDPSKSKFIMSLSKGVFRFVTGDMSKQSYTIKTPVTTMAVRGTVFTVIVLGDGTTNTTVEDGEVVVLSCRSDTVVLSAPGASTTVRALAGGGCSGPSAPAGQPQEFKSYIKNMDGIL